MTTTAAPIRADKDGRRFLYSPVVSRDTWLLTESRGLLNRLFAGRVVGAALSVLYLAGLQRVFVNGLGALSGSRCVLRAERCSGRPAVLGVFRPKVILPVDFESRYTRLERLLVFSRERTHLRRGDTVRLSSP